MCDVASPQKQKFHELLSPAGAGIVLICFFLPWLRVSCGTKKMLLRGSDMGGALYIVLIAAILMLIAFAFFGFLGKAHKCRHVFLWASLVASGTIAYKYITVALNPDIPFYIPGKMIGFELKIGAFGTILGLLLAGLGALLLGRSQGEESPKKTTEDSG
jgi:hypothetical protein